MAKTNLIIVGAGGLGREVAAMLYDPYFRGMYRLEGFVDDDKAPGTEINDLPVLGPVSWLSQIDRPVAVALAIGDPGARQKIYRELSPNKSIQFPNLVHPWAHFHDKACIELGQGNIICDGSIFTTNIKLGDCNLVNLACTIGHDVKMGSFCSVMPGVNISGGAQLQDGVYLGTGASLIKATTLGSFCTIGAGAVVNTDIPAGATAVGVPARVV